MLIAIKIKGKFLENQYKIAREREEFTITFAPVWISILLQEAPLLKIIGSLMLLDFILINKELTFCQTTGTRHLYRNKPA